MLTATPLVVFVGYNREIPLEEEGLIEVSDELECVPVFSIEWTLSE